MNLAKLTVLVYGHGGAHMYLAMRIAEDVSQVLYYEHNRGLYPHPKWAAIGAGMPGITVIESFEEEKHRADLFVFPYSGDGDIQRSLREEGKRVFGSGDIEKYEQDRPLFAKALKERGLPVAPHKIFTGIEALRHLSKDDPGWWIKYFGKHSTNRGAGETFYLDTYIKAVNELDKRSLALGCLRDTFEFMGEKPLPGFETGSDRFYSGGAALPRAMWGFELKNLAYVAKVDRPEDMPRHMQTVANGLAPVWKKHNACCVISDETRITKDNQPHCVDLTPRFGSPPGEGMARLFKNLTAMIWACAGGEMIEPEPIARYMASVNIKSPQARSGDVPLTIKEKDLDRVALKAVTRIKGQIFNICLNDLTGDDDDEIATAIGFGDDLLEAQADCLANAEKIDAPGVWYPGDCFEEMEEVLAKAEKVGLKGF